MSGVLEPASDLAAMVLVVYGATIVWLLRLVVRNVGEMRRDGWPKRSDFVEVAKAMRDLPSLLGDRVDHWLMGMHQPAWTGEPQPAPCRHCRKKEWPCALLSPDARLTSAHQ